MAGTVVVVVVVDVEADEVPVAAMGDCATTALLDATGGLTCGGGTVGVTVDRSIFAYCA